MQGRKTDFFFEVCKLLAVYAAGWGLATLAGAQNDRAHIVGLVTFSAFLLGRASRFK